jgi:putative ABC transport system permease protein
MSFLSKLMSTFQSLLKKEKLDQDLDEELQSYLELLTQEKVDNGLDPEVARREARLELGGVEQVKERVRENRLGFAADTLLQDIRYTFRALWKNKGFAVVAVLILAIGIGAVTALFSTVNTVLWRQIPFDDPNQLVVGVKTIDGRLSGPVSTPDYYDYRELNQSFEDIAQFANWASQVTLTGGQRPELVRAMVVTWNLFAILRANPIAGRHFLPEEGQVGTKVVLISYGFWQRRFGGSSEAVGTVLHLNSKPYTIVGVMPRGFRFVHEADLWRLINREDPFDKKRDSHSFTLLGRLKQGVTIDDAQSDVGLIAKSLEQQYPDTNKGKGLFLLGLHDAMVSNVRLGLLLLMATTVLVLLIACGNVAGLLLARGQQRLSEIAMRTALGAPRRRLIRQLITESMILTLIAGVAGIAVAYLFQGLLLRLLPMGNTGTDLPSIDGTALAFALLVSIATGLVVGVMPAFRGTSVDPSQQLKTGTHSSESVRGSRLRSGLVILQVAVSIVLLIGSGLLIRSLMNLTTVELGFDPDNLLTGTIRIQEADYATTEERNLFFTSLLEEIQAQPGVVSAAMISKLPILNPWQDWPIWLADQPRPSNQDAFFGMARWVPPGYFETMRIPLLEGRDISKTDVKGAPQVVVLSEAVVEDLFPNREPIGQLVKIGWSDDPYQVIGVVSDARLNRLERGPDPALYMSAAQLGFTTMRVAVRTSIDPKLLIGPIENLLRQKDTNAVLVNPATMTSIVQDALGDFRIVIFSLSLFAIVALALTAIGLYGVLAYHVSQRTNEIGIRLAMGASNTTLLGMFLKRGLILIGIGLALGLVGAYSGSLVIQTLLFETKPLDATTYLGAVGFLGLVALAACFLPAWRATRVSLVEVLRSE